MKSTIVMNNAMKYYTENELLFNNESCKEKLSEEMDQTAYSKVKNNACRKWFMPTWLMSDSV